MATKRGTFEIEVFYGDGAKHHTDTIGPGATREEAEEAAKVAALALAKEIGTPAIRTQVHEVRADASRKVVHEGETTPKRGKPAYKGAAR
jgi:hypothetical protein